MTTGSARLARRIVVIVIAAGLLAGCAGRPGLTPAPSADPEPSPSASPVEEIEAPTPFVDASCAELLSTASLATAFAVPVAALELVDNIQLSASSGPLRFALRQVGGVECEWSNGEPVKADNGPNPGYVGVTLRVLPAAEERWSHYAQYYSVGSDEQSYCTEEGEPTRCLVNALVSGAWLELELQGARGSIGNGSDAVAVTRSLYDEFSAAVASAPASSEHWAPPTGTIPLKVDDCDQFLSSEDAAAIVGASGSLYFDGMDGGASLVASAWKSSGGAPCPWVGPGGEPLAVFLSWLPGGEWAWLEHPRPETYEPVEVAGLTPDDAAWLDCPVPTGDCLIDLVVGHNWIQLAVSRDEWADFPIADKTAVLTQLAARVVESVRS